MGQRRVVVIGAGVGGLVAALRLAAEGLDVVVVERAAHPGGKLREVHAGGHPMDAGPTVFTLRWVFEEIFSAAGTSLAEELRLHPLEILARHAWDDEQHLDLFADVNRSADAIAAFAGPEEGRRYLAFCEDTRHIFNTLKDSFMTAARPTPINLVRKAGISGFSGLWRIKPFQTMWHTLGTYFEDPRLRQLFGRYATYCGSSPFQAPATLMLVAHAEQEGVWTIEGGMIELVRVLVRLAQQKGVSFRFNENVDSLAATNRGVSAVETSNGDRIEVDSVVFNGDVAALEKEIFRIKGKDKLALGNPGSPSLSAITWNLHARVNDWPLIQHNVFFSKDYGDEFDRIFRHRRLPRDPTVYVCAMDRWGDGIATLSGPERLFCLVNAPACDPPAGLSKLEIDECESATFKRLRHCGLDIQRESERTVRTGPQDFAKLFPGSGGALYGRASHGWRASFNRPTGKTRIPGLYLAGGSTHPGAGIPMAALSGKMAAESLLADLGSTKPSRRTAIYGGMSTG